jgi:quercetin dioxygenase-like cupin family protein
LTGARPRSRRQMHGPLLSDRLDEHSAPGSISLSVREGRVRSTASEQTVEAGTETVLICNAGVSHSVEAVSDAVCLLHVAAGNIVRGSGWNSGHLQDESVNLDEITASAWLGRQVR